MNNLTFASSISPALSDLCREDLQTINMAMAEFFTPVRGDYKGFSDDLLKGAYEEVLPTGLHATIWPATSGDENAPSVLLVHGWAGNSAQLSPFVLPLLASGKRVVAIDMWAHGYSPGVESNCIKFAEGIVHAHAELGPFEHAIGHSLGAAAVINAAHMGVKFRSVVLISPPSILFTMQKFLAHKAGSVRLLEPFILMSETYVGHSRSQADCLILSKQVNLPMLLIHDDMDRRCPSFVSEKLAEDAPNRKMIKTHGYGHHRIIRAPEVIEQTVDYLSRALVSTS